MVGEAIEQRGGHLGAAEHADPLAEAEIGGDDDAGTLVEFAEEIEQQCAAGWIITCLHPSSRKRIQKYSTNSIFHSINKNN